MLLLGIGMNYSFITIEGNIGAGKTTLANLLSKHFNARLILEEFDDNPFLPKFYENPAQYAFPLELFFMAERYKQLKDLLQTKDIFQSVTISDYLFTKSLLFAKVNLSEQEFLLYQRLFDIINPQLMQPDLLIYLHADVTKLKANIKKRNRSYEQSIPSEYLSTLQETYVQYIKQHNMRTLIVDMNSADFLNNKEHFEILVDALDKEYEDGQYYLSFL